MTVTTRLNEELSAVRGELARLDGKCSTLAGLAGAALAFVVTRATAHTPGLAKVCLAGAGGALAASTVVLLAAILRPRLGRTGFNRYAERTPEEICKLLNDSDDDTDRARDLEILSHIARSKNRRLRMAVDLIVVAVVLLLASGVASIAQQ